MKKLSHCAGAEFALRLWLRLFVVFGWLPIAIADVANSKPAGSRLWPMAILSVAMIVIITAYEFGSLSELVLLVSIGVAYVMLGIFFLTSNYHHL